MSPCKIAERCNCAAGQPGSESFISHGHGAEANRKQFGGHPSHLHPYCSSGCLCYGDEVARGGGELGCVG